MENLALSIFALYGVFGIRSINKGFVDLKEKLGILTTIEEYFNIDLSDEYDISSTDISKEYQEYRKIEKYI